MESYKNLLREIIINGQDRETRSGKTRGVFGEVMKFDLTEGFPAVTSKKLQFQSVMGELLWFMNGETSLKDLRKRSNLDKDAWTIWTNDCERWHNTDEREFHREDLGYIYGSQWRQFGKEGMIDQLDELINRLKKDEGSRYHLVTAWNPEDFDEMALPPCHHTFQCYVREKDGEKYLDLMWHQRSVDSFLGLPFNIASYAALTHILAGMIGAKAGMLTATLGDTHIYHKHFEAVSKLLDNPVHDLCIFDMPIIEDLSDVGHLTAKAFKLINYMHSGVIRAELSVG